MKASEHEEAIDAALDALASDSDVSAAEYQTILGSTHYSIGVSLQASVEEHGDLSE